MSTTTMEEFPSLPLAKPMPKIKETRKSKLSASVCSSVSTTSIGAFENVCSKIPVGPYCTLRCVTIRRHLKCYCEYCGAKVPKQHEWDSKCNKAIYTQDNTQFDESVVNCEVTDSKVVRRGKQRYSVAYIRYDISYETSEGNTVSRTRRGWVLSKYLARSWTTSQSVDKAPAIQMISEVDRSRSPSVMSFAEPTFRFGDLVLVRTDAATKKWMKGEVRQEKPLLILVEGSSKPQSFHAQNIKTPVTRQFVLVQDLTVRSQKILDSWDTCTLEVGTTVEVAYMDGFEGRIVAPVQGWISMRQAHSLNVIEPDWTYSKQEPSIIVKNLPGDITLNSLKTILQWQGFIVPKNIEFQSRGGEFRAVVSVRLARSAAPLVDQKHLVLENGTRVTICWDLRYLKNVAALKLRRALKH